MNLLGTVPGPGKGDLRLIDGPTEADARRLAASETLAASAASREPVPPGRGGLEQGAGVS